MSPSFKVLENIELGDIFNRDQINRCTLSLFCNYRFSKYEDMNKCTGVEVKLQALLTSVLCKNRIAQMIRFCTRDRTWTA
jgi:hypothetical protein